MMWKRPPGRQIMIAQARIQEAIMKANGKIQISWSGGKDSTFLLYLYSRVISTMFPDYKNKPIEVVFADTTNESKGIYKFIEFYPAWLEDKFGVKINLNIVRPQKDGKPVTMVEVIKEVGLPFTNKAQAEKICHVQNKMKELEITFYQIENHITPTIENVKYLRSLGFGKWAIGNLIGWSYKNQKFTTRHTISKCWLPLLWDNAPRVSDKCCYYLYSKKVTMATNNAKRRC